MLKRSGAFIVKPEQIPPEAAVDDYDTADRGYRFVRLSAFCAFTVAAVSALDFAVIARKKSSFPVLGRGSCGVGN